MLSSFSPLWHCFVLGVRVVLVVHCYSPSYFAGIASVAFFWYSDFRVLSLLKQSVYAGPNDPWWLLSSMYFFIACH